MSQKNYEEFEETEIEMLSKEQLDEIQEKIGYVFKNAYLLEQAFIRSSYAEEHHQCYEDNEKLEFVGDAALNVIIVKKMTEHYSYKERFRSAYETDDDFYVKYKDFLFFTHTEGEMTEIKKNIVKAEVLAKAIEKLEIEQYLFMSKGDIKEGVQNNVGPKEDLFEAIIGAIAIDSNWNYDIIEKSIDKMLSPNHAIENGIDSIIDYMEEFHKWWKNKYGDRKYEFFYEDKGDDAIACSLNLYGFNGAFIEGVGKTKKEAENNFAKRMYDFIKRQEEFEAKMDEIIGEITLEKAVNQLQELYQKKLIEEPIYYFEEGKKQKNGNPTWYCSCNLEKAGKYAIIGEKTKPLAKKQAAYTVLMQLIGKDEFSIHTLNEIMEIIGEDENEGN